MLVANYEVYNPVKLVPTKLNPQLEPTKFKPMWLKIAPNKINPM